jgi:hypothetical protein
MRRILMALALLPLFGTIALAEGNRYAVVAISNPTALTLHYHFRWGNGPWQARTVEPGDTHWESWRYDYVGQNRSPAPTIRYDEDLTERISMETRELEAYASPVQAADFAKRYEFRRSGNLLFMQETN